MIRARNRPAAGVLTLLVVLVSGATRTHGAGLSDVATAAKFAQLFLDEQYDALVPMMTPTMQTGFAPAAAAQVHAQLVARHGAFKSAGAAWREDTLQGYERFRVPVTFARDTIDLRVVIDGDGKVGGFFHAPHLPAPTPGAPAAAPRPDVSGHWEGAITLPATKVAVQVDLRQRDANWVGSCDIPAQGATGLQLADIEVEGDAISFTIFGVPGAPTFRGTLDGARITGTFEQGGQSFPFALTRGKKVAPRRPQEPKPPFPYDARPARYANGDIEIAGTLTLPRGDGTFPAVLMITGSGPQDRNEEVFKHKPFLVIADHLTRAGIAVLRVDDRGVGASGGSLATATTADLATDAAAGVRYLKSLSSIDGDRIGLIGHSEGGVIAPIVAAQSDDVAFIVLLAGTGVPGADVLVRQLELIMRASGATDAQVEPIVAEQARLLRLVAEGADEAALRAQAVVVARTQAAAAPGGAVPTDAQLEHAVASALGQLQSPWFRYFVAYDPREALRRVRVPVLAINGELDLQVCPKQNLPAIRAALDAAGNDDVTLRELPGLNHLFQHAETGAIEEYLAIEETFDPATLDLIRDWILARFGG